MPNVTNMTLLNISGRLLDRAEEIKNEKTDDAITGIFRLAVGSALLEVSKIVREEATKMLNEEKKRG